MSHDLSFSHIALNTRQFNTGAPIPYPYTAMEPVDNLKNPKNIAQEPERNECRALNQGARSAIDDTFVSRTSQPTLSTCQQFATSSRTSSPQRTSSCATPPRSRTKAKKVSQDSNFVKRPLNSFMLYRKDNQHNIPTNNHQSISRIIGDMWRKETAETKNFYDVRAKEERERHLLQHPGYKFQPKKKKKETKLSRPELKSQRSSTSLYSNASAMVSVVYDQDDVNQEQQGGTDQQFQGRIPIQESQESFRSNMTSHIAPGTYLHEQEDAQELGTQHSFPLHYAHYAGHVQYLNAPEPTEYQSRHSSGTMLKDPQDWDLLSSQCHYAASAALYAHQGQAVQPEHEHQWPEPYDMLDYNTPATLAQWENVRMADIPMFQETLPAEFPYQHEQDINFAALDPCDGEDFLPNHMKLNDMTSFAPSELKGTWEIEHVESQFYHF